MSVSDCDELASTASDVTSVFSYGLTPRERFVVLPQLSKAEKRAYADALRALHEAVIPGKEPAPQAPAPLRFQRPKSKAQSLERLTRLQEITEYVSWNLRADGSLPPQNAKLLVGALIGHLLLEQDAMVKETSTACVDALASAAGVQKESLRKTILLHEKTQDLLGRDSVTSLTDMAAAANACKSASRKNPFPRGTPSAARGGRANRRRGRAGRNRGNNANGYQRTEEPENDEK